MNHLGARAAALVDGELGHEARDRALSHLALCTPCRSEVSAQRLLKRQLLGLGDPTPPSPLCSRLLSVPAQGHLEREWEASESAGRGRHVAFGVAASVVGLVGGAFLLAGAADSGPQVRPPVDRFSFQQTSTSDVVPFDVGVGGFTVPTYLRP